MADKRYIGSSGLAKRYNRAIRTIMRYVKEPPPGFPTPIKLNGRNLWDMEDIERYEAGFGAKPRSAEPEAA